MNLCLKTKTNQSLLNLHISFKREDRKTFIDITPIIDIEGYSFFLMENSDNAENIINRFKSIFNLKDKLSEKLNTSGNTRAKYYSQIVKEIKNEINECMHGYDLKIISI